MTPARRGINRSQQLIGALSALSVFLVPLFAFAMIFFGQRLVAPEPAPSPAGKTGVGAPQPLAARATSEGEASEKSLASSVAPVVRAPPPAEPRCSVADMSLGLATVSKEDVPVMASPEARAEWIADLQGKPRVLDPRYDVKILEEKADWVRVAAVSPEWPPGDVGWSGWIERKNVQRIERADEKTCLFVDTSKWKGVPVDMRASMRETALRILHDDQRCRRISRGGFLGSGQRFFFTCYPADGGKPYHYWTSLVAKNRDFHPPPLVDETVANSLCRTELEQAVSRRTAIEKTPAWKTIVTSSKLLTSGLVHYLTLAYRRVSDSASSLERDAHCIVTPAGNAEITLAEP